MGMGMGTTLKNGYGHGYGSTRSTPAPRPSLTLTCSHCSSTNKILFTHFLNIIYVSLKHCSLPKLNICTTPISVYQNTHYLHIVHLCHKRCLLISKTFSPQREPYIVHQILLSLFSKCLQSPHSLIIHGSLIYNILFSTKIR